MAHDYAIRSVALVVDPSHPRFGEKATVLSHDNEERGTLLVRFADNTQEILNDGLAADRPILPQAIFLSRRRARQIHVIRNLRSIKKELRELKTIAENNELPHDERLAAGSSFRRIVCSV